MNLYFFAISNITNMNYVKLKQNKLYKYYYYNNNTRSYLGKKKQNQIGNWLAVQSVNNSLIINSKKEYFEIYKYLLMFDVNILPVLYLNIEQQQQYRYIKKKQVTFFSYLNTVISVNKNKKLLLFYSLYNINVCITFFLKKIKFLNTTIYLY